MKARGYATAGHFGSEPGIGAFSMRLHGFKNPPFDHYMLPLFSFLKEKGLWGGPSQFCFENRTAEMLTVDFAT
jgi:hypothetical protein